MVTATNGTATFVGRSGRTYNVNLYIADVLTTKVKFSPVAKAGTGSDAFIRFDEDVLLTRLAITTGPTVTTALVMSRDGSYVPGAVFSIASYLDTLANPSPINLGFKAGVLIGAVEA